MISFFFTQDWLTETKQEEQGKRTRNLHMPCWAVALPAMISTNCRLVAWATW